MLINFSFDLFGFEYAEDCYLDIALMDIAIGCRNRSLLGFFSSEASITVDVFWIRVYDRFPGGDR
jgi:hypothetical protein